MSTSLWRTAAMLLLSVAWTGLPVQAASPNLTSDFDSAEASTTDRAIATSYAQEEVKGVPEANLAPTADVGNAGAVCDSCGECSCCGCGGGGFGGGGFGSGGTIGLLNAGTLPGGAFSERRPVIAGYGFSGWDNFSGVADGRSSGNNGFVNGLNVAAPLPVLSALGIGWQTGASYGYYDLSGRSNFDHLNRAQQQFFVTTGLFRRADVGLPISGGIVYDWQINNDFGIYDNSPTLGQWRGQLAWALGPSNELGMFGMLRDRGDSKITFDGPQEFKAISQGNFFWHHKYRAYGADSWIYIGLPDRHRLAQTADQFFPAGAGRSLGAVILGTNWLVPLNDRMALYANGMYMKPTAHPGVQTNEFGVPAFASVQEYWNISFGVAFYPGSAARSRTVAGRKWMPYLPVANNSTFLVDTNRTD